MGFIRSQERMVFRTVYDLIDSQLQGLGWMAAVAALPFGATTAVTVIDEPADPAGVIAPNTVALSEGRTNDDDEGELGAAYGGLWETTHTFFIDVFGESSGISRAIASDIRAVFTGRLPDTNRYVALKDYSTTPVTEASGHLLRFDDVEVERPLASAGQLKWEVVKVTVVHEFSAGMGAGA